MSLSIKSLELKLKPPGATAWTIVDGDREDPAAALAVGDFTVSWGRPNPMSHPEPGDIGFSLLVIPGSLDEALVAYDTQFTMTMSVDVVGREVPVSVNLAGGWITSWTRTDTNDGRHLYTIRGMDGLGRAAASLLAGASWPMESISARLTKIRAANTSNLQIETPGNSWFVGPRDVDAANALDVLHTLVRPAGSLVMEVGGGTIGLRPQLSNPVLQNSDGILALENHYTARIPARMIQNTGRRMDRTSTITELAVAGYPLNPETNTWTQEKQSTTHYAAGRGFSASRLVIDSDALLDKPAATATWAHKVMAGTATNAIILEPCEIFTNQGIDVGLDLRTMMDIYSRAQVLVIITGDRLPGVERVQYLCKGRVTITGRTLRLGVTMLPAKLFGVAPLKFSDLDPVIRPKMKPYSGNRTPISRTSIITVPKPYSV